MEPWEALDLDYSDVHSLLRPLKRHRSPQRLSGSTTSVGDSGQSLPILDPCSRPSTQCQSQHDKRQSDPNSSPPILIFQSQRISTQSDSNSSTRLIPGPAGAVQAAMQRRTRGDKCFHVCDEEPVPTQEYIKRVLENGDEEDDDFNGNSWLCALDFVRDLGAMEGNAAVLETPLNSIKNGCTAEKIDLVVAIIKNCTTNGLGGMMVTLKDPTGTIDATIHHRVISEGNYGKGLTVGAVLILQKVAVFSPTRFVHVLNVTSSNILKVISKDSGPHIKLNHPTSAVKDLDSVTGETHGEVNMLQKGIPISNERTETTIMNNLRKNLNLRGSGLDNPQITKSNAATFSSCEGSGRNDKNGVAMDQGKSNRTSRSGFSTFHTYIDQERVLDEHTNDCIGKDTDIQSERARENQNGAKSNFSQIPNNQEAEQMNEVEKKRERTPRPLLPQWTDEQLDELFVFD